MSFSKKCTCCKKMKCINDFHKRTDSQDGRRNQCKSCKKKIDNKYWSINRIKLIESNKKYKEKNKHVVLSKARDYKSNNREQVILTSARKRAEKKGIDFNLTINDIVIPDYCPLLRIKLNFNGSMNNRDTSPSVDRIDPSKGYIKGNIAIISYRANRIKNNATPDELKLIASRIDEYSTEQVASITFKSVKSKEEKTVIEISDEQ